MTPSQIRKFSVKVERLMLKDFNTLADASEQVKLDFLKILFSDGIAFLPEASFLITEKPNMNEAVLGYWKTRLTPIEFNKVKNKWQDKDNKQEGQNKQKSQSSPQNFELDNEIMKSLHCASGLNFCRNWSRKHGCSLYELLYDYNAFILSQHKNMSHYQMDSYIFTYYINKAIRLAPELIIKPKPKKECCRSIVVPDYSAYSKRR